MNDFSSVIQALFQGKADSTSFTIFDAVHEFEKDSPKGPIDEYGIAQKLNAAFFILLMGSDHPCYEAAESFLNNLKDDPQWKDIASFYLSGRDAVESEINARCQDDPEFAESLKQLSEYVSNPENEARKESKAKMAEMIHSVFFPEATGIRNKKQERIEELRNKRTITITELNDNPIKNPAKEILFTSNVLLTIPSESTPIKDLPYSDALKEELKQTAKEPQLFWFDHPIQIGVESDKNEILYGLRGLDQSVEFERDRGRIDSSERLTVVLSVSVTHKGLQKIAGQYLKEELVRTGGLKHIDVFLFTEKDTRQIISDVLVPVWTDLMGDRYG